MRLLIEPGLARLAAERATAEDVALLRQSIRDFENAGGDTLKIVSSDLLFHRAIFQASKNRVADIESHGERIRSVTTSSGQSENPTCPRLLHGRLRGIVEGMKFCPSPATMCACCCTARWTCG
ncbi:MAG: FCD domain-containing protein [Acidobacteriaceae bacterium]